MSDSLLKKLLNIKPDSEPTKIIKSIIKLKEKERFKILQKTIIHSQVSREPLHYSYIVYMICGDDLSKAALLLLEIGNNEPAFVEKLEMLFNELLNLINLKPNTIH